MYSLGHIFCVNLLYCVSKRMTKSVMSAFSRYTLCVCADVRTCACVCSTWRVHTHRNARVRFVGLTAVEGASIRVKKGKQRQSKGTNHALRRLGSGENSPSPPLLRLSLLACGITNISIWLPYPPLSFAFARFCVDSRFAWSLADVCESSEKMPDAFRAFPLASASGVPHDDIIHLPP